MEKAQTSPQQTLLVESRWSIFNTTGVSATRGMSSISLAFKRHSKIAVPYEGRIALGHPAGGVHRRSGLLGAGHGQGELKGRTWARIGRGPQLPAVRLDNPAADRQPQPHPLRLGRIEGVEQVRETLRGEPDARIAHRHPYCLGRVGPRADL